MVQQVPIILASINTRRVIYTIKKMIIDGSESTICFSRLQCHELLLLSQIFFQLGIFPQGSSKNLLSFQETIYLAQLT